MQKKAKKTICLTLIMIFILSTIVPIISNATTESLINDETLYATIYDYNGDGIISKYELEKVYRLQIWAGTKDLSGLEYATNVRSLYYEFDGTELDFSKVKTSEITSLEIAIEADVDFDLDFLSKFPKLKSLEFMGEYSDNIDLSKLVNYQSIEEISTSTYTNITDLTVISQMKNLKSLHLRTEGTLDLTNIENLSKLTDLYISYANIQNASGIGELSELERLEFYSCTGVSNPSYLKNNTKLTGINMRDSDVADISFASSLQELEGISLDSTQVTEISALKNLPKLNYISVFNTEVSETEKINMSEFEDYVAYIGEKKYAYPKLRGVMTLENWSYSSSNEGVATVSDGGIIEAIQAGETTITLTNKITGDVRTFNVKVNENSGSQDIGTLSGTMQISEDLFLKENGELWKVHIAEGKSEKVDSNITKCVRNLMYPDRQVCFYYTIKMKNDGSAELEFNGVKSQIDNVKDIGKKGYLSNDGTYYELTAKGTWEKIADNVESIVGEYLVKNDGKTYTITGREAFDFKIIAAKSNTVVDENKVVWKKSTNLQKIGENFKQYLDGSDISYSTLYETEDGKIWDNFGNESEYKKDLYCVTNRVKIDKQNNALLNNTIILSNVCFVHTEDYNNIILIREDGSIWLLKLNGEAKLEQVVEQEEKVFLSNNTLTTKSVVLSVNPEKEEIITGEALLGLDINDLSVANVVTNFNSDYAVKIYKDGQELTDTQNVSTGSTIMIYNNENKLVKEYTALIYGDVTGRGNPGAADALAIVKNKTGKLSIDNNLYLEAGRMTENTRKTGGVPNATDALAIIKAKLDK